MAKIQLDILSNSNANRNNAQIYSDVTLDLLLNTTYNNQLNKTGQITDINADYNLGAIFNSISNIMSTNPGQKPLNPAFGVGLQNLLFLPVTADRAKIIGEASYKAVSRYEPRVNIINVNVIPRFEEQQYTLEFTVAIPRFSTQQVKFVGVLDKSGFFKNN